MSEQKQIPSMLKTLCILSWIGNGLGIILGILAIIGAGAILANIPLFASLAVMHDKFKIYFIISIILAAIVIYGVFLMWQGKKLGFFIYAGANILSFIVATIFGGLNVPSLVITLLFIGLYYLNFKHLE